MFQRRHLVAQTVIGQSAEIVPPCIAFRTVLQGIQRFPVSAETDVLVSRLLVLVTLLAAVALLLIPAKGIIISAIATVAAGRLLLPELVRILDLLIGRIDLLHFLGSHLITGI